MKRKVFLSIIMSTVVFMLLGTLFTFTETKGNRNQFLSQLIYSGLEHWHYSGKKIDNDFSEKAFWEFLDALDPNKRYLLQTDIEELRTYKNQLDDQFANGDTGVMKMAINRLELRVQQIMGFYEEILSKPFDFASNEYIQLDPDKKTHCTDGKELKELWRKVLKYRSLLRYLSLKKAEEAKNKESKKAVQGKSKKSAAASTLAAFDPKLEEKARKAVAKSLKRSFERLLQTTKKDGMALYLNSLVQVYDPHTFYFPPLDKETFDMQMSGSFEGIGALLREEDGYVKVSSLIPGGPSWKGKLLGPGDAILKVGQGDDDPEDIVGMRTQDAVKLIRGKKGTLVKLTVKKPDGEIMVVPIKRDVVVLAETFARSAVVSIGKKENAKRFGYIYLPRFYNDFGKKDGRNSTDDVREEVEKLKAKNVEGIILDLRSNSGGALTDAVRMSGLFFSEGPVVQVKDQKSGIYVHKDPDSDTVYSGPMVVMVNSLSASASEILAAALQDYSRAVIVGSNQSFGKGTVQAMIDLDRVLSRKPDKNSRGLGALTITVQKFYRIDGTSIQQRGVTPDVILPDQFSALEIGERHLDYSLNWDSIPTSEYEKWKQHPYNRKELAQKSVKRTQEDPRFNALKEYITKLKGFREQTLQSLQMAQITQRQKKVRAERKLFEKFQDKPCGFNIEPSKEIPKKDSDELYKIEKERQDEWFKQIGTDFQLKEALHVLTDMAGQQKSATS